MIPFPEASILNLLQRRGQTSAAEICTVCRMMPGEVRSRLAHLESLRHVTSRQDKTTVPPTRVYLITTEGRRKVEP